MYLFDVPLYGDDFVELLTRFAMNLVFLTGIVRFVYYRNSRSKDYLFSFYVISVVVFFICFTMKKLELELGMALGLFAIFGVLRYRTDAIPVREMTYLFLVIGVAVVNSLSNERVSLAELAFINVALAGLPALLESLPLLRQEERQGVLYERIDLIAPHRRAELLADLEQRTGLKISRLEMGKINLLQDTVVITVFYYPHEQAPAGGGEVASSG